jgi:hypothetical protein
VLDEQAGSDRLEDRELVAEGMREVPGLEGLLDEVVEGPEGQTRVDGELRRREMDLR